MIQFENAIKRYGEIILNDLKSNNIKCWIAGGALRDYFTAVIIKTDYDLFFPNLKEFNKAVKYFKEKKCQVVW